MTARCRESPVRARRADGGRGLTGIEGEPGAHRSDRRRCSREWKPTTFNPVGDTRGRRWERRRANNECGRADRVARGASALRRVAHRTVRRMHGRAGRAGARLHVRGDVGSGALEERVGIRSDGGQRELQQRPQHHPTAKPLASCHACNVRGAARSGNRERVGPWDPREICSVSSRQFPDASRSHQSRLAARPRRSPITGRVSGTHPSILSER